MTSITIHNLDSDLERKIRSISSKEGKSLNKTIKKLLRQVLRLSKKDKSKDFKEFLGVWNAKDYNDFHNKIKDLESINVKDWR